VRLLCTQYLLNGIQGNLIPDRIVRVSVKSLALGCIAAVVRLHPKSLIIDVYLELDNILQKPGIYDYSFVL
jgi:huntingtin